MKTIYPPGGRMKAILRQLQRAARTLAAQPWPVLLGAAIVLAIAITLVPLVLGLFCVLLLLKFLFQAIFGQPPRRIGMHREQ